MNIGFQRSLDRVVGTAICRIISLMPNARRHPSSDVRPNKILVILLTEMGSLVLASPMFMSLKKKYPDASLFGLVFEQNKEVLSLLNVMPQEHILTVRTAALSHLAADSLRVVRKMRVEGIDTVIDCELFLRISSIYSYLSGASLRAGFHRHTQEGLYRGDFINRPVLYNPYLHISEQFVNLAEALESEGLPRVKRPVHDTLPVPSCDIPAYEIDAMSKRLSHDFPWVSGKKIVLVYPGGGLLPIRAWPLPYFFGLVEALTHKGYVTGIIGMERDKEIAKYILLHNKSQNCIDLTGYTKNVRELLSLFHLSSLLITNDGGPGHFASLTPMPSIIFYGAETPVLYGPLGGNAKVFYTGLSCSPCLSAYNHRTSPCDGNNACLKAVHPEAVLEKALEILERANR